MTILIFSLLSICFGLPPAKSISTSELMRRKLYDLAAHPKNPEVKIASAQGIFIKLSAKDEWQPLAQFNDKDFPVLISPQGDLFVSTERSTDAGKTFSHFVAWDDILSQVVAATKNSHNQVKVIGLKWQEPRTLKVVIDAGVKNLVEVNVPLASN